MDAPIDIATAITKVREDKITYLSERSLKDLSDAVIQADQERLPGLLIEAGTALGGSAIVMALSKAPEREMRAYDAFDMIPPPTDKDGEDVHKRYAKIVSGQSNGIGGTTYYGYRDDLLGEVKSSFERYGVPPEQSRVELIKGYFEDSLQVDGPVAVAHLDGDWYESTKTCLERVAPHVVVGGRLVIDDYYKWSGCRRAVEEYFDGREGYEFVKNGRLHIMKRADIPKRRRRWVPRKSKA